MLRVATCREHGVSFCIKRAHLSYASTMLDVVHGIQKLVLVHHATTLLQLLLLLLPGGVRLICGVVVAHETPRRVDRLHRSAGSPAAHRLTIYESCLIHLL